MAVNADVVLALIVMCFAVAMAVLGYVLILTWVQKRFGYLATLAALLVTVFVGLLIVR